MRWVWAIGVVLTAGMAAGMAGAQSADRFSSFQRQLDVLDGRASDQYRNSDRLQPPRAEPLFGGGEVVSYRGTYSGPYLDVARDMARRHLIPEDLFLALVSRESGWNPQAVSEKGALGLAQLMPGTAAELGVDPLDPTQNLEGGARYLRAQFERFGNWRLALAAYNAGPEAVVQYGGVPPFDETRGYVRAILGR